MARSAVVASLVAVSLAAVANLSAADVETGSTRAPFSETKFNPCVGEEFLAEGYINSSVRVSMSPDGRTHFRVHSNLQGVKGVSASGARYVVVSETNEHTNTDSDAMPFNSNLVFKEHYVRQREDTGLLDFDDDFIMWARTHLTINANGDTTSERLDVDFECR